MKDELPSDVGFMCPDAKKLTVQGGVVKDDYRFELQIRNKAGGAAVTNRALANENANGEENEE